MKQVHSSDEGQLTLGFGGETSVPEPPRASPAEQATSREEHRAVEKPTAERGKQGTNGNGTSRLSRIEDPDVAQAAVKRGKRTKQRATAESMAKMQRDISVSEFFAKNRHLLGFDNKRKALLMTVKEAVDNALDACEEAGNAPEISVSLKQVGEERFRVRVRDNGPGIVKQQIPNIFGKLLYGSKFHRLKMSRGQQGIGISAAGMYGLLTTGKSIKITSRTSPKKEAHYYEIQIDTRKNAPNIVKDQPVKVDWDTGTEVEIELVGSYNKGRQSVDEYIEETAIANPHAVFHYHPPSGEAMHYPRGTDVMPEEPETIKPHPYGVELGTLIKMLHETKSHWLSGFLQSEFCRVSGKVAEDICKNARLNPRAHPKRIARKEAENLYEAIQKTKLRSPPTNCLSPIGAEQILAGMLKGVRAEFFTASTRPPAVYRGNPFQIEVGLAYGGDLGPDPREENGEENGIDQPRTATGRLKKGANGARKSAQAARLIRFANRVPLLYQQSACAMFKSVVDLDWRRYGLSQSNGAMPQGPMVVMVHMASVWVPFTSESKEAIADYDEIRQEIRLGLQDCSRKLAAYLNRRRKQRYEGDRRSTFTRYIGEVVEACSMIKKIDREALGTNLLKIATKVTAVADEELDQHGRPIRRRTETEFGENTVVVDRDAEPVGELFARTAGPAEDDGQSAAGSGSVQVKKKRARNKK